MRQIEISDALIELAEAIILQAITDFISLRSSGAILEYDDIEVNEFRWRRGNDRYYSKPLGFQSADEARQLVYFFQGPDLDFLCDLVGKPADRIRKNLKIQKKTK